MRKTIYKSMVSIVVMFSVILLAAGAPVEGGDTIKGYPIWKITKDGTAKSVRWRTHRPNPRFAIYDSGTRGDESDDIVLDKETGLVWERYPSTAIMKWYDVLDGACLECYDKVLGGRKGWRLPTIEELTSLVDPSQDNPSLPIGHPFDLWISYYWSSTTNAGSTDQVWGVYFNYGNVHTKFKNESYYVWCVRGGQGHDAY